MQELNPGTGRKKCDEFLSLTGTWRPSEKGHPALSHRARLVGEETELGSSHWLQPQAAAGVRRMPAKHWGSLGVRARVRSLGGESGKAQGVHRKGPTGFLPFSSFVCGLFPPASVSRKVLGSEGP